MEPIDLRTDRPHPARVYDYLLGGKDNFAADRAAAEQGIKANPASRTPPREIRAFLRRAVRFLAAERGIDQFLDIGTGIPSAPNVHHVAQQVNPTAVHASGDEHATSLRERRFPASGVSCIDHFLPFHLSASGLPISADQRGLRQVG